jgi:hypothetical protein
MMDINKFTQEVKDELNKLHSERVQKEQLEKAKNEQSKEKKLTITRDELKRMKYTERLKFKQENPEGYKQLVEENLK